MVFWGSGPDLEPLGPGLGGILNDGVGGAFGRRVASVWEAAWG